MRRGFYAPARRKPPVQLVEASDVRGPKGPQIHFERDWCTKDGAKALGERIKDYWRERGHHIQIELRDSGFIDVMRTARVDVRSNMVSGYPKTALPAQQRSAA